MTTMGRKRMGQAWVTAGVLALWALGAAAPAHAESKAASAAAKDPAELVAGDPAPAFSAVGDDGKTYSLAALKGRTVVLYFYPKDDTPGCTAEAQGFRDDFDALAAKGVLVLGVSLDSAESHKAFREKHKLNFPLLVDGAPLAKSYGVPVFGSFAARQTFVIGPDGKLRKVFRQVNPRGHSAEILGGL
jgi:peroxiredoxin Q/BCP